MCPEANKWLWQCDIRVAYCDALHARAWRLRGKSIILVVLSKTLATRRGTIRRRRFD
jgi:hypothetical protein